MLLHELLRRFQPFINTAGLPNPILAGLSEDSRTVKPGDLFIVRAGLRTNGAQYVEHARQRGAVAVIAVSRIEDCSLPQIVTDDPAAASKLANLFHGEPSQHLKVIGVTGTNGKTTTTYLIRHILGKAGIRCGMIGTVEIDDGRRSQEAEMTTPGAVDVARLLAQMRANGCGACAVETSSHALDQHRVAGVQFAAAGFTNLTGDHLDYHKTLERYADAKARLFASLPPDAPACVNADDAATHRMIRDTRGKVVRWSIGADGDYRAQDIAITASGSNFVLVTPDGRTIMKMKLIGRHNIENALCAAALCCETFGLTVHQVAAALADASGAPGRLQTVSAGQKFAVLVDYAHTDDALENVLQALRPLTRGKLRVVFGCGGDRDRTKRPRMAQTAEKLADCLYVTSDNPRTEDPNAILDEVCSGLSQGGGKPVVVEADRRKAIERALEDAVAGDVVLIAGKGHENYQIIGTTKHHFDDVEACEQVLKKTADV